jgi:hypothetical protein
MEVSQLAAPGGLCHHPFGRFVVVEPAGVINQVTQHVRRPARGRAINRMNSSERTAGHDFPDLLVMLAVTMLMADDGFHPGLVQRLLDLQTFIARHRHGFLERNQFRAALDAELDEVKPQVRQRAEAEQVGLQLLCQGGGVQTFFRVAEFGRAILKPLLVNVADADDFELGIGMEGGGVMHAAFAHADDDDGVLAHGKKRCSWPALFACNG